MSADYFYIIKNMPKTREQKQQIVQTLQQDLKTAKSMVFVDYYGLKVKEVEELRKSLKEHKCKYFVCKKTLLKLALNDTNIKDVEFDKIQGGVGLIFGLENELEPAKIAMKFAKNHEQLSINGGIFESKFISADEVKILANLPSKNELIAQVMATIKAPVNNLVYVLNGCLRNLVYVLSSIKDNK